MKAAVYKKPAAVTDLGSYSLRAVFKQVEGYLLATIIRSMQQEALLHKSKHTRFGARIRAIMQVDRPIARNVQIVAHDLRPESVARWLS